MTRYLYADLLISKAMLVLIIILAVMIVSLVVLFFVGRHLQKKQEQSQKMLEANRQEYSMLIIDKKKMKLTQAGLPQSVIDSLPKFYRRSKMYIVKAKVGQRVMSFICDYKIFEQVPVKKEVKAGVSGLYLLDVKGIRGSIEKPEKKKGFFEKLKQRKIDRKLAEQEERLKKEKAEKKAQIKQRQEENRQAMKDKLEEDAKDTKEEIKKPKTQVIRRGNHRKRK